AYLPLWSRKLVSWAMENLEKAAARRFSALVTVTPTIAERFRSINSRTVVVHNFPSLKELVFDHSLPPWQDRRQSVAYIGGMMRIRAIDEMVEAMNLLPDASPAVLELAGPHPDGEPTAEELLSRPGHQRLLHHGFVSQQRTFEILRNVR